MTSRTATTLRSLALVAGITAGLILVALVFGSDASTQAAADQSGLAAQALVAEIAEDLVTIRDMDGPDMPEDNLSLAQVTVRLEYLRRVDQKIDLLHTEFAHSEVLEQRATRRVIERYRAQQGRMERLQNKLSAS